MLKTIFIFLKNCCTNAELLFWLSAQLVEAVENANYISAEG